MESSPKTSTAAGCRGIYLSKTAASKLTDESIKWAERKPIGIRFNPSEEVLAGIFLLGKVFDRTDNPVFQFFRDINVYKHDPWNLSDFAHDFGEEKMYFFTLLHNKYRKGTIIDRTTPGGIWKKTGSPSYIDVMYKDENIIATKTCLAFYKNCENSGHQEQTAWLMQEYMLDVKSYEKAGKSDHLLALCVVYFKNDGKQKQCDGENESGDERN